MIDIKRDIKGGVEVPRRQEVQGLTLGKVLKILATSVTTLPTSKKIGWLGRFAIYIYIFFFLLPFLTAFNFCFFRF
jgi:hypothetical protein